MPVTTEPVTEAQLKALQRCVSPMAAAVGGLYDVDLRLGRGVLEGNSRCLWTKDGHRVTVTPTSDGGLIIGCGKEPDPERPTIKD